MNINIVCVGKVKEKYIRMGIDEFSKRLSKYCKLNIIEVSDEKTKENMSDKETALIKNKEGERILSKIKSDNFVICLAIEGKKISSEKMAKEMNRLQVSGKSTFTFVIGGSVGLSDEVLKRADMKLSFSDMTYPHQLMRLILLEQIYRWFRINNNEPYHK